MASFTGVGDTTSLTLSRRGDIARVALSGTYDMTIALQREEGSPGSGSWSTIKKWSTANATVSYDYSAPTDDERLRLNVLVDNSGTCTATISDVGDVKLTEITDPRDGSPLLRFTEAGAVLFDKDGLTIRNFAGPVNIGDVATYEVLRANNGRVHLIPDLTADCAITLPTPFDGAHYEFIYIGVAADAQDWNFDAGSNTYFFKGGLLYVDDNPTADSVAGDGNSNSKMNVLVPEPGTRVVLDCDGTNWMVSGVVAAASAPTFADQS